MDGVKLRHQIRRNRTWRWRPRGSPQPSQPSQAKREELIGWKETIEKLGNFLGTQPQSNEGTVPLPSHLCSEGRRGKGEGRGGGKGVLGVHNLAVIYLSRRPGCSYDITTDFCAISDALCPRVVPSKHTVQLQPSAAVQPPQSPQSPQRDHPIKTQPNFAALFIPF
jgi:hypothetical protein